MGTVSQLRSHRHYPALLLGCVGMVAGAGLLLGDRLTSQQIARERAADLQRTLAQVVPPPLCDNDLTADPLLIETGGRPRRVFRARRNGVVTAVAFEVVEKGYSGEIVLLMAVDPQGRILGVRVVRHTETPGLGDKIEAKKSDWIDRFRGRTLTDPDQRGWAVKKDGGEFDQFTGATITPRAVVKGVHEGLEFFASHRNEFLSHATVEAVRP